MSNIFDPIPYVLALFAGMSASLFIGRQVGLRWFAGTKGERPSFGSVEGAIFALYGLLIAFTFSGAPARLETRAYLGADEVNAIGSAYLRLDLLPSEEQPAIKQKFREYVDSRIAAYRKLPDIGAARAEMELSADLQRQIWQDVVAAAGKPGGSVDALKLLVPALNTMIEITTTREVAMMIHPPRIIFGMLLLLACVCSALAGFGMAVARRSLLHTVAFVGVTVLAIYAVLAMEYPRLSLLPMEDYEMIFTNLRSNMK